MAEFIIGNPLRKLARQYQPLRQLLWWLDFVLVWVLLTVYKLLPVDAASRMGERVGAWIGPRLKRKSLIVRANVKTAWPALDEEQADKLVRQIWGRAGRVLAEYPHLHSIISDPHRLEIDIREAIETYQNPARPCVIVTAHISNWEIAGAAMARLNIPNATLYSPPANPRLNRMLLDSRAALNCQLLPRDNSARLLMRALMGGRSAAMVMDRRIDGGQPIDFFGHSKPSTLLPAKLALKFNCDMVPVQVQRLRDARYRVIFHPPVRPTNTADNENAQAANMIQQVHKQFEDWINQQPQDWFCSKRLWPRGTLNTNKEAGIEADIDSHAA